MRNDSGKTIRAWLIPAIFAAFLFVASVPCNLVATYLQPTLEPYRLWIWILFALGIVATAAAAILAAKGQSLTPDDSSISGRSVPSSADDSVCKDLIHTDIDSSPLASYAPDLPVAESDGSPEPDFASSGLDTAAAAKLSRSMTIIVPAYNEVRVMGDLMAGLWSEGLLDKYRVILCDDGSTDDSFAVMQEFAGRITNLQCIRNWFNQKKVGAILEMARLVQTPYVLTLDADCSLSQIEEDALESLMARMAAEDISVCCFRIVPQSINWLGSLQKLDYAIFSDALRRLLGIPLCLIGQCVLWKTDSLLEVLSQHSGEFDGDDLENTVIALTHGMKIHWERRSIVVRTKPKQTLGALLKQRALSWDFGLLRALTSKRARRLRGESGAFYKNLLLLDVVAHPFRVMAAPLLLSVPLVNLLGWSFYEGAPYDLYRNSLTFSFKYGALAIAFIFMASLANSFACTRRLLPTAKYAVFNAVYLSSPFVYVLFYPLLRNSSPNAYDTMGAAMHWLGLGLLLTYLWWSILTLCLLCITSLDRKTKLELSWCVILAPLYYFTLLIICKSVGILKFMMRHLGNRFD